MAAYLVLALAQLVGLLLIPVTGWAIWVQLATIAAFAWWTDFQPVGMIPLGVITGLVVTAELIRLALGAIRMPKVTRRRMGMAGLAGAVVGAALGVPLPLVGSMFGALLGAFAATLLVSLIRKPEGAPRMAQAAQAVAMTLTVAAGVVIAIFTLLIVAR